MILSRENLAAHVAPKEGDNARVRLGPTGSESTDARTVYLHVPYPDAAQSDLGNVMLPAELCAEATKAMKSPRVECALLGQGDGPSQARLVGHAKTGDRVELHGPPASGAWREAPVLAGEVGGVILLHVDAIEKLLKASKVLGAEVLELRLQKAGMSDAVYTGPTGLRLLDDKGATLASGLAMPVLR